MFHYQLPLSASSIAVSGHSPATITFQPSAYISTNIVHTIVYNLDGREHRVVYTEFPPELNIATIHPRDVTVDHYIDAPGTYTGSISVYTLGNNLPDIVNYSVTLSAPDIFDLNLLKSSMINTSNEMLYVFESKNPKLIAPVKINWPQTKLAEPIQLSLSYTSSIRVLGQLSSVEELANYLSTGLNTGDAFQIGSDVYVYDANTNTFSNIGRTNYTTVDYFYVLADEDYIPLLTEDGRYISIFS